MSRSSFQLTSLYERLYAWRFLIGVALLLLVGAVVVWLVMRPGGDQGVSAIPTTVTSPPVAETTEGGESLTDTSTPPPVPSLTPTSVSASATPQAPPTETPVPEPTAVEPTATPDPTSTPTAQPTPVETASPTPTATPTVAPTAQIYKVVWGDSLWRIAERIYGDGQRWRDIYRVNTDVIADPRLIRTGWELRIP